MKNEECDNNWSMKTTNWRVMFMLNLYSLQFLQSVVECVESMWLIDLFIRCFQNNKRSSLTHFVWRNFLPYSIDRSTVERSCSRPYIADASYGNQYYFRLMLTWPDCGQIHNMKCFRINTHQKEDWSLRFFRQTSILLRSDLNFFVWSHTGK